ncbi:MAG TPA: hypothetical protein DEH25_07005 [Chloroflexi bacterium]|nr:hypothetical protein [Chloroflexota bacterium]
MSSIIADQFNAKVKSRKDKVTVLLKPDDLCCLATSRFVFQWKMGGGYKVSDDVGQSHVTLRGVKVMLRLKTEASSAA